MKAVVQIFETFPSTKREKTAKKMKEKKSMAKVGKKTLFSEAFQEGCNITAREMGLKK